MREGDIVLTPLPPADGQMKNRPAVLLRELPPFGDYLACGVSTQLRQAVPGFGEVISRRDADFAPAGFLADSVIRLGFLAVLPPQKIVGAIGRLAAERHVRLLKNLSKHLVASIKETPNRASEATSEPAPGAASSAPQG
jgi:mRNA interferase MazF